VLIRKVTDDKIDLGNVVTFINKDNSFFYGIQGQVIKIDQNMLDGEVVIQVGPNDDYIFGFHSFPEDRRIRCCLEDLRKEKDWNIFNRAAAIFGKDHCFFACSFAEPEISYRDYCMREGCFMQRRFRALVLNKGNVFEYEVCGNCFSEWQGRQNAVFPAKKEYRVCLVK
jgi:hypothetical protein